MRTMSPLPLVSGPDVLAMCFRIIPWPRNWVRCTLKRVRRTQFRVAAGISGFRLSGFTGGVHMSGYAVRAEGLEKRYGEKRALDGFDLAVREGTVHGLLGPNGAGKTTAVRILSTLIRLDGGQAQVAGLDVARQPREVRARIGLTGQYAAVDEVLTGRQNLEMFGRLFHLGGRRARLRAGEEAPSTGKCRALRSRAPGAAGGGAREVADVGGPDTGAALEGVSAMVRLYVTLHTAQEERRT
ncbi:hypothetical protein GCM10010307_62740 [Streptomyces vastus]|uniref:ABC transporter domain-containing protein n=1 Tax=Streptomyces vastus TaxID=285451 RepID=A0ABP6DXJ9_9ACTN